MLRQRLCTSEDPRAYILFVSLRDKFADRPVGLGQRGLVGQEHDAEVAGTRFLSEAGAVDHQHVLLAAQFFHKDVIAFGDLQAREGVERAAWRYATHTWRRIAPLDGKVAARSQLIAGF